MFRLQNQLLKSFKQSGLHSFYYINICAMKCVVKCIFVVLSIEMLGVINIV